MNNKYNLKKIAFLLSLIGSTSFGMNLTMSYDSLIRVERESDYRFQFSLLAQGGFSSKGYDEDGCRVNILRIWNDDQNALKMLDGFDATSSIGQMRIRVGANDDGVRGHFLLCGDSLKHNLSFSARWSLPEDLSIVAHFPFYFDRLKNVTWDEQTKDITADDARTKQYLTNDFVKNVFDLGNGLCIEDWKRSGLGDTSVILEWNRDFKQTKELLKNVAVHARSGVVLPIGKRKDEDKIFSLSFGNDGGVGLLFGAGLDITFGKYVQTGFDVTLQHVFGNTRCRRIKTHEDQTELLLLAKTNVLKDFGLTQQFNLFIKTFNLWNGFSCLAGYQFIRHGDDSIVIFDHAYSESIANTAKGLEEWTMHNAFFSLSYNFDKDNEDRMIHPYVSAFVKVPFNGVYSSQLYSIGLVASIDF